MVKNDVFQILKKLVVLKLGVVILKTLEIKIIFFKTFNSLIILETIR